jgi:carbonic anhydrase
MKNKFQTILRFLSLALILLIFVVGTSSVLSGCGSSDAATKKSKSKKSKKSPSNDEETDSEESETENKKDESNSENEEKVNLKEKENSNSVEKDEKSVPDNNSNKEKDTKKSTEKEKGDSKKSEKSNDDEGEKIWTDLMKGNQKFVAGKHTTASFISVRKQLMGGQKPEAIILGCADSRVPPELVFDKNLGELFVVREAGNVADSIALGSIEYAVEHLHSKVLVILGHDSCGAVTAAVSDEEMPTKNLAAMVNKIAPAFEGSKSCPLGGKMNPSCVELNIQRSAKDVLMNSPIISKAVKEKELKIIRAVYHLGSGKVVRLD